MVYNRVSGSFTFMLFLQNVSLLLEIAVIYIFHSVQFSSVTQSCLTLCDPVDCSMPGLHVHHQLPEFTQTHWSFSFSIRPSEQWQGGKRLEGLLDDRARRRGKKKNQMLNVGGLASAQVCWASSRSSDTACGPVFIKAALSALQWTLCLEKDPV